MYIGIIDKLTAGGAVVNNEFLRCEILFEIRCGIVFISAELKLIITDILKTAVFL